MGGRNDRRAGGRLGRAGIPGASGGSREKCLGGPLNARACARAILGNS